MTMRIWIAPSGYNESLTADEVADPMVAGVLRTLPGAGIRKVPLVDGRNGRENAPAWRSTSSRATFDTGS